MVNYKKKKLALVYMNLKLLIILRIYLIIHRAWQHKLKKSMN